MIFQKKIDRAMNWLKEQNTSEVEGLSPNRKWENEEMHLEKKDRLALWLSALLVFLPIFLILFVILLWIF